MLNSRLISPKNHILILALLAITFFFIYSYLSFFSPTKFNQPDDALNYFFTKRFVETSSFAYDEPLNQIADGIIHPRNSRVVDSKIVPMSFLGLYLISGAIGKILGIWAIMYVVPFISAIACIFFYLFFKEIFSCRIAFLSSIFLLIHPGFWYFSSRAMHHNALFIALLIISFYFLVKIVKGARMLYYILFGFFMALACITRTSEIIWLGILIIFLLVVFRKKINIKNLVLAFIIFILTLAPMFYYNNQLYGRPFTVGYLARHKKTTSIVQESNGLASLFPRVKRVFLPSGINLLKLKETILKYIIKVFSWFTLLSILGILFFVGKLKKISFLKKIYFWSFIFITLYLILYYGSGAYFGAKGRAGSLVVEASFVRYWLPIYIFSLPFIALAFVKINDYIKRRGLKILTGSLIIGTTFLFSLNLVYFKESGLLGVKYNTELYQKMEKEVSELTEDKAVIVAPFTDKFLFPQRKVIGLEQDLGEDIPLENKWPKIKNLMDVVPVYYFAIYGIDIEKQNQKLEKEGIKLVPVKAILDIASLHRFEKIET